MKCRELVSVAELTSAERTAFVNAILALKTAPSRIAAAASAVTTGGGSPNRYDDYVWMHSTVGAGAHFGSAFGPWHREFLRQFEFDLRQVSGNPDIVIPYWDWTTGRVPGDPNWPFTDDLLGPLGDAAGLVPSSPFSSAATWRINIRRVVFRDDGLAQVPDPNTRLRRRPATVPAGFNLPQAATARAGVGQGTPYDVTPFNEFPAFQALINGGATQTQLNNQITAWTSASFRKFLEWRLHNGPHTWVGGQDNWSAGAAPVFIAGPMSIPQVSVNDPVFWLHHCNIDRLWSTWQQRNPPGAYLPATGANAGHNLGDQMVHFEAANAANFNLPLRSTPADVVDSRGALDIWYTSDLPSITLVTPSVDFGDVPANLTTDWPVKFDVRTCRPVKFRITGVGGTNFSVPPAVGDVVADHDHDKDPVRANVFIEFHALGTPNVVQPGTATIAAFIDDTEGYFSGTPGTEHQVATFTIGLSARPVPAPRAAVTLVLDRSGSMSDSAGPAGTKYDLLQSALRVVAALMRGDDAIGLVSYDDLVDTLTPAILAMGSASPPGAGRTAVETAITSGGLTPRGATGIGQAMIAGANLLQTVQFDANYATKAMVVMTDGNQNRDPSVTDATVQAAIAWFSNRVYAIGLGAETNVSAPTLGAIARYQLVTGEITSSEQRFLLTKYFLQILAQITDNAIVVDPQGELRPGQVHRIPFDLSEGDVSVDVIAICPVAPLLDLTLEAPDGTVITPSSGPNVALQIDGGDEFYRIQLPAVPANAGGTHAGRWTAILGIRDLRKQGSPVGLKRSDAGSEVLGTIDQSAFVSVAKRGALPYQLFVQSYSNITMNVDVRQGSFLPGAKLQLVATLKEYRRALRGPARIVVEVTEPDGREVQVQLGEVETGRFEGVHTTTGRGIYSCRFRANGTTRGGKPFQREETRTAVVNARLAPGGDLSITTPPGGGATGEHERRWCALISCLLAEPSIVRFLAKHEVDPTEITRCLKRYCAAARAEHTATPGWSPKQREEDETMSEETDRLRKQLQDLRAELRRDAAFDTVRWNDLLDAAPAPRAVTQPQPPVRKVDMGEAHHTRALPAMVTDDDGTTRVIVPPGHHATNPDSGHDHPPGSPDPDDHSSGEHGSGGHSHGSKNK